MRDLAWSCFSPSLLHIEQLVCVASGISSCNFPLTAARRRWLAKLDHNPSALLEHLAQRPTHRLGLYFEQLWHFFLQQDPHTELLAHNFPVQGENRTLGEFDCIYYCAQRDCHVHLELAVKYFLGTDHRGAGDAGGDAHDWLGPDRRDRLDSKLQQLLHRQILLGENAAAQPQLRALGVGNMVKEIALKGYLFWPRNSAMPAPTGYNYACARNYWLRCDELKDHCATLDAQALLILPRMRWLSRAQYGGTAQRIDLDTLTQRLPERFAHDTYPLLIVALDRNDMELSRFFVTPELWPHHDSTIVQHSNLY